MVDVFISYSRTDLAAVTRLAEAVEAEGYDVWWDADLPPHLSYGDVITAKIGMAKAAIVVWSKESAASEWVRAEADMARNQKKLVQTALGDVMPPLPFNQIQFAEMGGWHGEADHPGWRKVKASLAELCGRTPETVARTERPAAPQAANVAPPAQAGTSRWLPYASLGVAVIAVLVAGWVIMRESFVEGELAAEERLIEAEPREEPSEPDRGGDATAGLTPGIEVLPFSSDRPLSEDDIGALGAGALRIARNEIYARHGRRFRDPQLTSWFERFPWYEPTSFEVQLSAVESRNVAMLQAAEARAGQ